MIRSRLRMRGSKSLTIEQYGEIWMSLRNSRVAIIGDSIAAANSFDAGAGVGTKKLGKGMLNWAAYLGRQRWTFDPEDNFGVSGDDTGQVLARTDAALATSTAGTFVVDCMTNDDSSGITVAQSKINYNAIISKIVNSGRLCILIPPRPRDITASGLTMTAAAYLRHVQRRQWILGLQDLSRKIIVIDVWKYFADPSSTNGAPVSGSTYDGGVHPNVAGGYLTGLAFAEVAGLGREAGIFPYYDVLCEQNTDLYDATNNPTGAINSNPMLIGGASVATGYTNGTGGGLTNTASKVASGNRIWQQIALSGAATSSADVHALYQTLPSGSLTVGDVLQGYCDLEVDSCSNIAHIGLSILDTTTFTYIAGDLMDSSDSNAMSMYNVAHSGVLRTSKFTVPVTTTVRAGIKCRSINTLTAAATFRVCAMAFRKAT